MVWSAYDGHSAEMVKWANRNTDTPPMHPSIHECFHERSRMVYHTLQRMLLDGNGSAVQRSDSCKPQPPGLRTCRVYTAECIQSIIQKHLCCCSVQSTTVYPKCQDAWCDNYHVSGYQGTRYRYVIRSTRVETLRRPSSVSRPLLVLLLLILIHDVAMLHCCCCTCMSPIATTQKTRPSRLLLSAPAHIAGFTANAL